MSTGIRNLSQWVAYKLEPKIKNGKPVIKANGKAKMDKVPINPLTGGKAQTNNPATWTDFDTAVEGVNRFNLHGLGFVFTKEAGITGIDLDDCVNEDGTLNDFAQDVVSQMNSYAEFSPSNDGVHILVKGSLLRAFKNGQIEMYDNGRFFTYTGNRIPGYEDAGIRNGQVALDELFERVAKKPEPIESPQIVPKTAVTLDDQVLLDKAQNATNGAKFRMLWQGNISGYASQSEADFALCHLLAFWTGNDETAVDRLFRQSGLFREKWDEPHFSDGSTYGEQTIARAIANTVEIYQPAQTAVTIRTNEHESRTAVAMNNQMMSLQAISMAELLSKSFSPLVFLVHGLIALGHLALLAGRPKSGKSWLVLQLAMCVDTGQPFLGQETKQLRVLLIALEDGDRRVYQRAKLLKWVPSETAVVAFHIANFDGPDGTPGPGLFQIEQAAQSCDLIIIDTLIATLSGRANENDNVQMGVIINSLARIAHETNTAIVLVHHTGKGYSDDVFNTLRGASAIRGGYDVGLLLERKQGEKEAILHAESRDVDVENMTLRQVANGIGWDYVGNSGEIKKIRAGRKTLEAMLELDPDGNGLTVKEIATHRGVSESGVYKQLERLGADGCVTKIEQPSTEDGKQPDIFFVQESYR